MTGLQAGYEYRFRVAASNASGRAEEHFEIPFQTFPLGSCGERCPFMYGGSLSVHESDEAAAARTVAEQRALEAKEREAHEAAAKAAAEAAQRKHDEEEVAAAPSKRAPSPRCIVPHLKGDTLPAARRALGRAHCRLGKVHWPRDRVGTLRVLAQSFVGGRSLATGSAVSVTLGRAYYGRRGHRSLRRRLPVDAR